MSDPQRIIGLAGKAGTGKDTAADYVADYCRERDALSVKISFAGPFKEAVLEMFKAYGITRNHVYGPSELRNTQIGDLVRNDGEPLTVRYVLQTLGTELGRTQWHDSIWIDLALRRARYENCDVTVIPDCRFNNEFQALRKAGAELWHITRPGAGLGGEAGAHASEQDLDGPVLCDLRTLLIDNSGTLDDLRDAVAYALHGGPV